MSEGTDGYWLVKSWLYTLIIILLSIHYKAFIVTVQEAAAGAISVNVVGFLMGNAWIAPDEQIMAYGPMLYQLVSVTNNTTLLSFISLLFVPFRKPCVRLRDGQSI